MHELPVTENILAVAIETAKEHQAQRIASIHLVIGELTSIVDDSVQFYFDILSQDTLAEGSRLHFDRRPGQGHCLACQHQFEVRPPLTPICPACGSSQLRISGGKEFYIESIEVE